MKRILYICLPLLLSFNAPAGVLVQFRTTAGNIDVELYNQDKPVTVQNFIRYVKGGLYQNMFLHRCIPGFIVQGGGFGVTDPTSTNVFWPDGVYFVPTFGPITNEFNVGRRLTNSFGTIAMAKSDGNPNSATSQWFFNLANNSANLDNQNGGFTVFGRVVRGTNVLNFFNSLDKAASIGLVDMTNWVGNTFFGQTFSDLPVFYAGFFPPPYTKLIYVYDISLLDVQVQRLTNRTELVSWNSVAGKTNYVEFTTNMPPIWQKLTVTNGTGATFQVIDPATNSPRRFYRVRVDY